MHKNYQVLRFTMTQRGRALYDFDATEDNELSFKVGDVLTILNQDESGWWEAQLGDQQVLHLRCSSMTGPGNDSGKLH